jgi:hypothetical protein
MARPHAKLIGVNFHLTYLSCSYNPAIGPYSEPDASNSQLPTLFA